MAIRFEPGMTCCKSTRVWAGLVCSHASQTACARRRACEIALVKGGKGLDAFARHLLTIWQLCDVYWVFATAGEMSTLAQICKEQWLKLPDSGRLAYRAEVAGATLVYGVESGPYNPDAFMSTFDYLCETACERP